jgi:predicted transcriptional regulator
MIKSKEIAEMIDKDEGTVRNIILSLKVLGLIESKPGPNGGYIPTLKAYEIIKNPSVIPTVDKLSVYKGIMELDIKVKNIELLDITNPNSNRVILKASGDLRKIKIGDSIRVGPTPYSRLIIEGLVIEVDEERGEIVLDVKRMVSIPRYKVKNLISRNLVVLKPEMTLKEASLIFYKEGIRGAPVVDSSNKVIGILTMADIIKAFFEEKYNATVSDYMKTNVITIKDEDDILDAIRKMLIYNVGRLVVLDAQQQVVGIITRTDILKNIAGLEGI